MLIKDFFSFTYFFILFFIGMPCELRMSCSVYDSMTISIVFMLISMHSYSKTGLLQF